MVEAFLIVTCSVLVGLMVSYIFANPIADVDRYADLYKSLFTVTATVTITDDETGEVEVIEKPKRGEKRKRSPKRTVRGHDGVTLEVVEWDEVADRPTPRRHIR